MEQTRGERLVAALHARGLRMLAWQLSAAVSVVASISTAVQYHEARIAALLCATAAVLAYVSRTIEGLSVIVTGCAACVATAVTDREAFSLWPAATGLLLMTLLGTRRSAPRQRLSLVVAATAVVVGTAWTVLVAEQDPAPELFAAGVAAVLALVAVKLDSALGKWMDLRRQASSLRALAAEKTQSNLELKRREALARELHDSIGHHLTAMVVQAEAGQVTSPTSALTSIGDLGREALDELEAVLFDLRCVRDTDLARIETRLVEPLRAAGVHVDVDVRTEIDGPAQAAAYRIVQEALTNVMRHADATHVKVDVHGASDGWLVVRVQDDGRGLPAAVRESGSGIGGMRARAEEHQGALTVSAGQLRGTVVEARLRLDA